MFICISNDVCCYIMSSYLLMPWINKEVYKYCMISQNYLKLKDDYKNKIIRRFLNCRYMEKDEYNKMLSNWDIVAKYKLSLVPYEERTRERCLSSLYQKKILINEFTDIPINLINREFMLEAVGIAPILSECPRNLIDKEVCMKSVSKFGKTILSVPINLRDEDIINKALENGFVCNVHKNRKEIFNLIHKNGSYISYISEKYRTKELYNIALDTYPHIIFKFPQEFIDKETILKAVSKNGLIVRELLKSVYKEYVDDIIIEEAIKNNGDCLSFFPETLRTHDRCIMSINSNKPSIKYIPLEYLNEDICIKVVSKNGYNLKYVPDILKTKSVCLAALKNSHLSFKHIPKGLISDDDLYKTNNAIAPLLGKEYTRKFIETYNL